MDYALIIEYRPHYITGTCHPNRIRRGAQHLLGVPSDNLEFDIFHADADEVVHPEVVVTTEGEKPVEWDDLFGDPTDRQRGTGRRPFARIELVARDMDEMNADAIMDLSKKVKEGLKHSPVHAKHVDVTIFPLNGSRLPRRPTEMKKVRDGTHV